MSCFICMHLFLSHFGALVGTCIIYTLRWMSGRGGIGTVSSYFSRSQECERGSALSVGVGCRVCMSQPKLHTHDCPRRQTINGLEQRTLVSTTKWAVSLRHVSKDKTDPYGKPTMSVVCMSDVRCCTLHVFVTRESNHAQCLIDH